MGRVIARTPGYRFSTRLLAAGAVAVLLTAPTALIGATEPTLERASVSTAGVQGNRDSGHPTVSADGRFVAFESVATNLVAGDTNKKRDIFLHDRHTGKTTRVSVSSTGEEANGDSTSPSLSRDGSVVAFVSAATNLVPGDTNRKKDIFAHDRLTGETKRVSVSGGGQEANDDSAAPAVSGDGRFVAFVSPATNLVALDTNKKKDVFAHDRLTDETTRVSLSNTGQQGNGDSSAPAISDDGQVVAFDSEATNLVSGDGKKKIRDIFVRDLATAQTTRVSVSSAGVLGDGDSAAPTLSGDGSVVAFESAATNLVGGDTNKRKDIFVHDRGTSQTTRVSVGPGDQADKDSRHPGISGDGRFVAFESAAKNLITDDTNKKKDVFRHDRQTGITTRIAGADPAGEPNQHSTDPALNGDGSVLVFASKSTNLALPDANRKMDVFVLVTGSGPGANTPPVAVDDTASTVDNQPVTVAVLANDSDLDGDALAVTGVTQGMHGTVTFTAANATYTPAGPFDGSDTFIYTISDGHGGSASATVTVRVTPHDPDPETPLFSGTFPAPDRATLAQLPLPPVPGRDGLMLLSLPDGILYFDPSARTPLSAAAECASVVVSCFQPGLRNWSGCLANVPICANDRPWEGDAPMCCAAGCAARYQALRRLGENGPRAFARAIFEAPSCMPSVDGHVPRVQP